MAGIKGAAAKCAKCGYPMKGKGKCPRCGTIVQCNMYCSGNCLKCPAKGRK